MEPLIKDTPYKGHNIIYLHSKDIFVVLFSHTYNTFVTTLKRTKKPGPTLFGGFTVYGSLICCRATQDYILEDNIVTVRISAGVLLFYFS